ncbi:MAG TPA: tetratricopeptide repeat protein [Nitrospirota bacterium]|nr:tetratricopeptide repeat protein [Nitrospirota bacterium]
MSVDKMMSFADSLFAQGDYYRAITEYERVIFFYPDDSLAKAARFQIAESYFRGERFDQAIAQFGSLAHDYPNDEVGIKSLLRVGEVFYQKRDYEHATEAFIKFIGTYPNDTRDDAARLKLGWSYLRQRDWTQAEEEFRKLPAESPLHSKAEGLAEEAKHYPDIPKKSPGLAGGLSTILPGTGQLYIGKPGDALISFLLNGSFIWATAESFQHNNNATGGILLFFEAGWYLGNIYNAVNGAYKYNDRLEQRFMDNLHNRFDFSYYYDGHGRNMMAFNLKF